MCIIIKTIYLSLIYMPCIAALNALRVKSHPCTFHKFVGMFFFNIYKTILKSSHIFISLLLSCSLLSFLGLPHFSVEPHHMSTVANVSLSLQCVAHGPPEPVRIIWLQDGVPLNTLDDPMALSPSSLNLTGPTDFSFQNNTSKQAF